MKALHILPSVLFRSVRKSVCFAAVLVLGLSLAHPAKAQNSVRFGLAANPMLAWHKVDNPNMSNEGVRAGFQYGLLVDFFFDEEGRYAFTTGAIISMMGTKYSDDRNPLLQINDVNRLQYFEVPLSVKLIATELNYYKFFGQIGMVPGVNIRARGDRTYNPSGVLPTEVNRKINEVILVNIGLDVGAGVQYELAEHLHVQGGLFYRNGFVNIYNDGDQEKITLNTIGLNLSVYF